MQVANEAQPPAEAITFNDLPLLPHHRELLTASAVSPTIAHARGYRSVGKKSELKALGFSDAQCRVPGLVIPVWSVTGEVVLHQIRPDSPRMNADGKPVKYETPRGAKMALDVHPSIRQDLGNPKRPLILTEGVRKADAAVSKELLCIALLGVFNFRGTNTEGGKVVLPDWEYIALNDREVYIAFDSDVMLKPAVHTALARLKAFLETKRAQVRLIYLDPKTDGSKVGLDDFFAAGHTSSELFAKATTELRKAPDRSGLSSVDVPKESKLPEIVVSNRPLRDISYAALEALKKTNNPPYLFVRSGVPTRVVRNERQRPVLDPVGESALRGYLTRSADFFRLVQKNQDEWMRTHVSPPREVVQDVLALPEQPFPPLGGITECPGLRPDGTVLNTPGYDATTRLFYEPAVALVVPEIPATPSQGESQAALQFILDELLVDFPFCEDADRVNMLACLLTPIIRPAIGGNVPLCLLDKPSPGSGATLLADVVATIATGQHAAKEIVPEGRYSEEEWRKKITAILLASSPVVVFDNIDSALASGSLAGVLTTPLWSDRVLGQSLNVTLPVKCTWIATANNIALRGDLARRAYRVRIDARTERPWQREAFRHPDLLSWVREHRGHLLAALLIVARAWYAAGQPKADTPKMGGYEQWTSLIGGMLAYAGAQGFLTNLKELYEQVDAEGPQWSTFLRVWHDALGDKPVSVKELAGSGGSTPRIFDSLPESVIWDTDKLSASCLRLGKALQKRAGRVYGAYRLERAKSDGHAKVATWKVVCLRGVRGVVPSADQCETEKDAQGEWDTYKLSHIEGSNKHSPHSPQV